MSDIRPFSEVIFQWIRLLLADTSLSPRAVQVATYLAVVRYNSKKGKAWPAQTTICTDLGVQSTRTIQRACEELEGRWFKITRYKQQRRPNEYTPSKASHMAANALRNQDERRVLSPDTFVIHADFDHNDFCVDMTADVSSLASQKCRTKKVKEKTNQKIADSMKPPEWEEALRSSVFIETGTFSAKCWSDFCEKMFDQPIERIFGTRYEGSKRGHIVPFSYPPSQTKGWATLATQIHVGTRREV